MTTTAILVAGGVATVYLLGSKLIDDWGGSNKEKDKAIIDLGFDVPDYGKCLADKNCLKRDSWCREGQCIPYVARDDASNWIKWYPEEWGLKKYCGKYYLQGEGSKCDTDSQCSDIGVTGLAGIDPGKMATVSSRFYCSNAAGKRCETKGQNWAGVWYKRPEDDPLTGKDVKFNDEHKFMNRDKVIKIYQELSKEPCGLDFGKDQHADWLKK